MALTARLAPALLVAALATGCSQSLFDADGDDDPGRDGGHSDPDARSGGRDSAPDRPDARIVDGGAIDEPDASLTPNCPAPCAGDAFGNFDGSPDGRNGRWRYVEVRPTTSDYADMTIKNYGAATLGMAGTGIPQPGIAFCYRASGEPPCSDQAGTLVFITTNNEGANHPAARWTAPMAGSYRLSGTWTFPFGVTVVQTTLLLTRNGQSEMLLSIPTSDPAQSFETTVALEEGDIITLTAISNDSMGMLLGVNFYFTGPQSPQSPQSDLDAVELDGHSPADFQGVQP